MEQLSFFEHNENDLSVLADVLDYLPAMFTQAESNQYLAHFIRTVPWQQRAVLMYGKEVITPRLTAWYGDVDADYSVSGTGATPLPWTDELLMIREKVVAQSGFNFNTVLLNYYRDGNDSVSWHDDQDNIPGRNQIVASVSFGQERMFDIRQKKNHAVKYAIPLPNGSYLLMKGRFQDDWQHRIAKSASILKPRVNLTFRISNTRNISSNLSS